MKFRACDGRFFVVSIRCAVQWRACKKGSQSFPVCNVPAAIITRSCIWTSVQVSLDTHRCTGGERCICYNAPFGKARISVGWCRQVSLTCYSVTHSHNTPIRHRVPVPQTRCTTSLDVDRHHQSQLEVKSCRHAIHMSCIWLKFDIHAMYVYPKLSNVCRRCLSPMIFRNYLSNLLQTQILLAISAENHHPESVRICTISGAFIRLVAFGVYIQFTSYDCDYCEHHIFPIPCSYLMRV